MNDVKREFVSKVDYVPDIQTDRQNKSVISAKVQGTSYSCDCGGHIKAMADEKEYYRGKITIECRNLKS